MKGKIFNAQEVQAILNGSKVMFREVIKPQPDFSFYDTAYADCPYQVGQKIFVKETFSYSNQPWCDKTIFYKASHGDRIQHTFFQHTFSVSQRENKWRSPMVMQEYDSRLTPLIKEIRVERLGEISEQDAIAEGFAKITKDGSLYKYGIPDRDGLPGTNDFGWAWADWQKTAKEAFAVFWNATHKKPEDKFEASPFVWCVSFEVINN